jgi:very-short-patch-repair endonuclease
MKSNMHFGASPVIFGNAKKLRHSQTSSEQQIWAFLRVLPNEFRFRRQHPMMNYIADFYCHSLKLVIEVDGGIHNAREQTRKDTIRDQQMQNEGVFVLRITNDSIGRDLLSVQLLILQTIEHLRITKLK